MIMYLNSKFISYHPKSSPVIIYELSYVRIRYLVSLGLHDGQHFITYKMITDQGINPWDVEATDVVLSLSPAGGSTRTSADPSWLISCWE